MSSLALPGFVEAMEASKDLTFDQLTKTLEDLGPTLSGSALYSGSWNERLKEFYETRLLPVLRSAGARGREIQGYLQDNKSIQDASKIGSIVLLLALLLGNEPASVANLVSLALALVQCISGTNRMEAP
jgi:hypothetical protein